MSEELHPYGYTIFCDDIRHEISGKVTLVGCYTSHLYFTGEFPLKLARFGLQMNLVWPTDNPFDNCKLLVFLPGEFKEPVFTAEILSQEAELPPPPSADDLPDDDGKGRVMRFGFHTMFENLEIEKAGLIRVRALVDGATIRAGTLRVEQRANDEQVAGGPNAEGSQS